jgi:hypothetical protein
MWGVHYVGGWLDEDYDWGPSLLRHWPPGDAFGLGLMIGIGFAARFTAWCLARDEHGQMRSQTEADAGLVLAEWGGWFAVVSAIWVLIWH